MLAASSITVAPPEPVAEVLVADDEGISRSLVARALELTGFRCRQCADGEAALAEVERDTPALLLLDLRHAGAGRHGGLPPRPRARERRGGDPAHHHDDGDDRATTRRSAVWNPGRTTT